MGFNEDLMMLSERISKIKDTISTEEATKMSMVVPFFQILGYDIFNPLEFCPEYISDVGIKKGEKVDYAIMFDGEPLVLIESKWCGAPLDKHGSQLFRYFGTSVAKFGILTNGIIYRFYTDLDESNKMDLTPFLEINMLDLKENTINELKKFCKQNFDRESIFSTASELKYSNLIKETLKKELDNPSDEFTRFILSTIYEGQKNQKIIDKFKPIVKKTFASFINEIMNQKISSALSTENEKNKEETLVLEPAEDKIITTQLELEAFYILRSILSEFIDIENISFRDTESYFGIIYQDNNRKPICRLNLDVKKKQILIPDEHKNFERHYIESTTDIYKYKAALIDVLKRYISDSNV